jgi:hypothetical protein
MQREREAAGSDAWDGGAASRDGQGQRMPQKRAGRDTCGMHRSSGTHADVSVAWAWCALGPLPLTCLPVSCNSATLSHSLKKTVKIPLKAGSYLEAEQAHIENGPSTAHGKEGESRWANCACGRCTCATAACFLAREGIF